MVKASDWIVIGLVILSLPFIAAVFFQNFTATSIGLVILGGGITIKMFDMKIRSKAIAYMWIAIILIISVLLGIQYIIPKISFS